MTRREGSSSVRSDPEASFETQGTVMTETVLRALLQRKFTVGGPRASADSGQRSASIWLLRTALMAGCAIAIIVSGYLGDPSGFTHADPALARLLRGMALIKGVIVMAILAAVWWRFGRPIFKPGAAGYLLGSWILVGSTTLIWQLSWIALAAVLFHAAALFMLFVSWRPNGGAADARAAFPSAVSQAKIRMTLRLLGGNSPHSSTSPRCRSDRLTAIGSSGSRIT